MPDQPAPHADPIPVIDVAPLRAPGGARSPEGRGVGRAIGAACREAGFFYVVGHGVAETLCERLESASRRFFAQDLERKLEIHMRRGGRAWRGYFPVGAERTLDRPDCKEGLYFGAELAADHPRVAAGTPLHGPNLFPELTGFRETVLEYIDALTGLGRVLMEGIALGLGLEASHFARSCTADPLVLFRIFNYPALPEDAQDLWSVGEHTDYGLLTILLQDRSAGLELRTPAGWIDAPPLAGSFVCNVGDMLERMTGGLLRSTPHRVRNASGRERLSFPFFFDPGFDARVRPIDPAAVPLDDGGERWDGVSVHGFEGTYGDYLLGKVSRVFPELRDDVL